MENKGRKKNIFNVMYIPPNVEFKVFGSYLENSLDKTTRFNKKLFITADINPKMPGGRGGSQIDPQPCGFLKNGFPKERVKPWFFVTFNIIFITHLS